MTASDLDQAIARLPAVASNADHADRTRRRCRALLEQRTKRRNRSASRFDKARHGLTRVLIAIGCALVLGYVTALIVTTFGLQGPLH